MSFLTIRGGTVVAWGSNSSGQTNIPTGLSNIVAVAAGEAHTLALRGDATVIAWGANSAGQTNVPNGLTNVIAISAGGDQSLALRKDGTVTNWGVSFGNPPTGLNMAGIASGTNFHLALLTNSTVVAWGANNYGQTNVPTGLSNVVAVAAGGSHALALKVDGTVVAWGSMTNVPAGLSNVMAIAAGYAHSVALKNDGTAIAWGDNTYGQTNLMINTGVKLIAAGGFHTLVGFFSPIVQYSVDVTKDLLLIYNSNSQDSSNLCAYYLSHRPLVASANVLSIACDVGEFTTSNNCDGQIVSPVLNWLTNNPTKHPEYIVLFYDIPTRLPKNGFGCGCNCYDDYGSVSVHLRKSYPGWLPFVNHINQGTLADCEAYVDKLAYIGTNYSPGKLIISASSGSYGNTNYYFDDVRFEVGAGSPSIAANAKSGVTNVNPTASVTYSNVTTYPYDIGLTNHITTGSNVVGYVSWGAHSTLGQTYGTDGTVKWTGNSSWWIMGTGESFNGERVL